MNTKSKKIVMVSHAIAALLPSFNYTGYGSMPKGWRKFNSVTTPELSMTLASIVMHNHEYNPVSNPSADNCQASGYTKMPTKLNYQKRRLSRCTIFFLY